jgi:predicted trehalose synthase
VRRSAIDGLIEVLARVLARAKNPDGTERCDVEIDPDRTLPAVIAALISPTAPGQPAPVEVLVDAIADVNRAHPEVDFTTKLAAEDYASIASVVSDFCEDKASGLEQVYEVIREATVPGGTTATN